MPSLLFADYHCYYHAAATLLHQSGFIHHAPLLVGTQIERPCCTLPYNHISCLLTVAFLAAG